MAVLDGCGSTGETLDGVLNAVDVWRPALVILENVLGLRRNGQNLLVIAKLKARGYIVFEQQIDSD